MALDLNRYYITTWLKVTIVVPLCVFLFVAVSGYFFGASKNPIGMFVSWFMVIPSLTVFLSKIISGSKYLALKSLISLVVFYGIMVFGIYKHYQSDFFKIMIASLIFNSFVFLLGIAVMRYDQNTAK